MRREQRAKHAQAYTRASLQTNQRGTRSLFFPMSTWRAANTQSATQQPTSRVEEKKTSLENAACVCMREPAMAWL